MSLPDSQRVVFLLGPEQVELRKVPVPRPGPGEILLQIGTYSSTLAEQEEVYRLIASGRLDASPLVTHRLPLSRFPEGVELSRERKALKVLLVRMSLPDSQRVVFLLGPEQVELRKVPVPRPGPGEFLLQIGAATTCGTDVKVFRRGGHPRMLKVPTPFGHEMAGTVAEEGSGPQQFRPGERVVVANSAPCGECAYCSRERENLCTDLHYLNGAFAEYLLVPERFARRSTYRVPEGLLLDLAALTEPLACVLHGIDACGLREPSEVVIYGGGPIGLLFVAALACEGHRVVLADPNAKRLEAARSLGAAEAVQIGRGGAQADVVRQRARSPAGFQAAIDATGVPSVWADAIDSVAPGGVVNLFGGCPPETAVSLDTHRVHYSELTIKGVYHHRPATVRRALELLARRAFNPRVLLSAERPLEELEEALRSMMRKEALKVVIRPRLLTSNF